MSSPSLFERLELTFPISAKNIIVGKDDDDYDDDDDDENDESVKSGQLKSTRHCYQWISVETRHCYQWI